VRLPVPEAGRAATRPADRGRRAIPADRGGRSTSASEQDLSNFLVRHHAVGPGRAVHLWIPGRVTANRCPGRQESRAHGAERRPYEHVALRAGVPQTRTYTQMGLAPHPQSLSLCPCMGRMGRTCATGRRYSSQVTSAHKDRNLSEGLVRLGSQRKVHFLASYHHPATSPRWASVTSLTHEATPRASGAGAEATVIGPRRP